MAKILIAALSLNAIFFVGWRLFNHHRQDDGISIGNWRYDYESYCDLDYHLETGRSEYDYLIEAAKKKPPAPSSIGANDQGSGKQFRAFKKGQTLHAILKRQGISNQEIYQLTVALKPHVEIRQLAPGDQYRFDLSISPKNLKSIERFVIKKFPPNRVPKFYQADKNKLDHSGQKSPFIVTTSEAEVEEELAFYRVKVSGSLFQTFIKLPFGNELMQRLISIFAWHLPIPQGIVKGDEIEILVTRRQALGETIGYGKIRTATYKTRNKNLFAIYFESKDNSVLGYFDENGKSLEKEFCYSPVRETTATSTQKYRFHPIKKIRIPHNGTDYRGEIGDDFFSIADGRVIDKGFDKNVGNMIKVRHKYGVVSEYFHADALEDLPVGSMVKRGQKLGTIGQTGRLCTGPHLHMGLYKLQGKSRKYIEISSLKNQLQPARDIEAKHRFEFRSKLKKVLAAIDHHNQTMAAKAQ